METINTLKKPRTSTKLYDAIIIGAIALILSSCWSKEENYQKQLQKVQELEYKLKQQSENYRQVSLQQNIQQDLKQWWADPTINQEIWYSLDRAEDQDEKIAKTKKALSKAQKKLAEMSEDLANDRQESKTNEQRQTERLNTRLNPGKYGYIDEEYKRSRNN